jgi:hypothetical protein
MRNRIFALLAIASAAFVLTGCFKDVTLEKYSFYRPVYKTKTEVRAAIKSSVPQQIQNPGKLFVRGNYVFLNDVNRGIHIIDQSNPSAPKNIAFIAIPGNVDIAVNGNYLYADQYTDLVTLDINNPLNITAVNFDLKVFPEQYAIDTNLVIVDWIKVDTMVKNKEVLRNMPGIFFFTGGPLTNAASPGAGSQGKAGSMARFGLMNNRLYTVSTFELKVFNVTNAADPVFTRSVSAGAGNIETIYPFRTELFLGSMSGMHIFSVANPDNPVKTGMFTHATACDPVITDGNYAYVTLRSGTTCASIANQMDVVNVSNITAPSLVKTYNFTNPHGLDKDGDRVFLCDGSAGLRVLDVQDVNNIKTLQTIGNINAYDVIAMNGVAITVAKDGLYFISYANPSDVKILSKISTAAR